MAHNAKRCGAGIHIREIEDKAGKIRAVRLTLPPLCCFG
jgi:hypothetical protein